MGKALAKGVTGIADLPCFPNLVSFCQKSVLTLDLIEMIDH
jgi:hypothetical protein